MRIEVKRDIDGEFADEQIALKAGTYLATKVRSGYAIPGQEMRDMPIGGYVLQQGNEGVGSLSSEVLDDLRRQELIVVTD